MTFTARSPALDDDLEIVDAHHHLGDKHDPPYFLDDLLADAGGRHRVTQTVVVECGWRWITAEPRLFASMVELEGVAAIAAQSRLRGATEISGIVGYVDLRRSADDVSRELDAAATAADGILVGIRHATAWDPSPQIPAHRTGPGPHLLSNNDFRSGLRQLAQRQLVFDAWLFHPQLLELDAVAADIADLTIVVDHLGGPLAIGPYHGAEVDTQWRSAMRTLARRPNIHVKLGGIGMPHMVISEPGAPVTAEQLARLWGDRIRFCIDTFGPSRCMFESDFPVDRVTCTYSTIWTAFKLIAAQYGSAEKAALFHQTARDVYRLPIVAHRGVTTD